MAESRPSVKIDELSDSNHFAWQQKTVLILTFQEPEHYIDNGRRALDFNPCRKLNDKRDSGYRKARAIIGVRMSDNHFEHVRDVTSSRDMCVKIKNVSERHTLRKKKLTARRRSYTVAGKGEKILAYLNRVWTLPAILQSMSVNIDEKPMAMEVLNGLP